MGVVFPLGKIRDRINNLRLYANNMNDRVIYSFIVDRHPKFAYQAWQLAASIVRHCKARPRDINIQITPGVADHVWSIFSDQGYSVRALTPFGDGTFCNKLAQIPNLTDTECGRIVLLDTDMVAVSDCRPLLTHDGVMAKVVDNANPKLNVLQDMIVAAGGADVSLMEVEVNTQLTVRGNANGGFYAMPRHLAARFNGEWQRWAKWIFDNDGILRAAGRMKNVDQISAALAFNLSGIPYAAAPSNLNYFLHMDGGHKYYDPGHDICFLHYHDVSMNAAGVIETKIALSPLEQDAVDAANRHIREGNHARLLRDYMNA